ncbi:energy-coupling factor ABC transporter permease [Shewanella sp. Isolate7]|uniref:energy-coupling factor ABC transporter permease n=1 Tax=Shewanella sp. Isolate7 TaxID=2908528 RepID=UPI001EFC7B10|nr:energy-coupling factor ABC transporter permease [Shewanella sp. Isolate7]MCG9723436.1 energy-coupling factor ABC transporter permease [Shewanella sp. Isolate7]
MTAFLLQRWSEINWQLGGAQLLAMVVLALWLWAIWPVEDVKALLKDKALQTRLLLAIFFVNALWLIDASITPGIHAHFLGIVTLMLMFGWRLATLALLLPVAFFATFMLKLPLDFAIYGLVAIALPLFLSYVVYSQVFKYLPHHLFVYIFCGAFMNAFLCIVFHILCWSTWLYLSSDYDWSYLADNYLLLIPLLAFPEALLNGMAVTLMVVYRPEWLYDYSDRTYF